MMELTDEALIKELIKAVPTLGYKGPNKADLEKVLHEIQNYPHFSTGDFSLFAAPPGIRQEQRDALFKLWCAGLSGAVSVLKWHDRRENPFVDSAKEPTPPDVNELVKYYKGFREYEPVLYGSDAYYRDHFAHVLRVWMTGIHVVITVGAEKLGRPPLTGDKNLNRELFSNEEVCAMFTIAALTHDMGYPLEKLAKLNDAVSKLLSSFGGIDWQQLEVSLSLPHHSFAQDFLKQVSSRPHFVEISSGTSIQRSRAVAHVRELRDACSKCETKEDFKKTCDKVNWGVTLRCQWKYHQKYGRSFEKNSHGLLSALLLQRKLLYFREGEFALEEDYTFTLEEARQFMARRDILRAAASHTCPDIYFLAPLSSEALLFFCDEIQDWGRPYFHDLYGLVVSLGSPKVTLLAYDDQKISWSISLDDTDLTTFAWKAISSAHALYVRLRSAPESDGRNFAVEWKGKSDKLHLEASFTFDDKAKKFSSSIMNTTTKKTADILPLLDSMFTSPDGHSTVVDKLKTEIQKLS